MGGDNCLYGLDPQDGSVQETICGTPWTSVSQRGVAYRDDNDTFYLGGWNENVIYHVKGLSWDNPGEVLEQHFFSPGGRGLAGMAWNDDPRGAGRHQQPRRQPLRPDAG